MIGPLPETKDGYKFVAVGVDLYSHGGAAYPMKNNTTQDLLDVVIQHCYTHGAPDIMFSDRGGNLLSVLVMQVYKRLGITKKSAAPHRHNESGMAERIIQSVIKFLTCTLA